MAQMAKVTTRIGIDSPHKRTPNRRTMTDGIDLSQAELPEFRELVDQAVMLAEEDPQLLDGIHRIDAQAFERGVSSYEIFFLTMKKHQAEKRAGDWLKSL